MDWNLETPTWDFTQMEQDAYKNINAVGASRNFLEQSKNTGDFSVDLKLGQVGGVGAEFVVNENDTGALKMTSSASGSSKRARGSGNGTQPVSCLVDGCISDLSNCRDYHRRHKVCELHSKTPQVSIGGQKQRFCQQCSRFHSLDEFDEGKRSCRKRLDGHNRRRRKPQTESLSRIGSILSQYQGSQLLPFSTQHVYPSTIVMNHSWAGMFNAEPDARLHTQPDPEAVHFPDKHNTYHGSSSNTSSYRIGKQLSTFLQSDDSSLEASECQSFLKSTAFTENEGDRSRSVYERFTNPVHDSDCALSLLSSGMGLSQVEQDRNLISFLQPLDASLGQTHNSLEAMDSVLDGSVSNADINCSGMFHIASDDGENEPPTSIPFHW